MFEFNRNPTRPAALYLRVSTARQEDEGTSLATQEAACRRYCAERGYPVAAVYREVYTGADLFERPQLSALRAAVRAGEVGVVVAHALDRLSRNQAHLGLIASEVEHAGAAIELVTEKLEDTPEGRLLQSVRGFVAEVERLKLAERTIRGRRARVAGGKPLPGPRPPYGYDWSDEDKARLVENPSTAPIVRSIFAAIVGGTSAQAVATRLTAEGVPTPAGAPSWSRQTVAKIVRHPVYTGEARAFRWQWTTERGTRHGAPTTEADQTVLAGVAPALVSPDIAVAAADRLTRNKYETVRNNRDPEAPLLRGGYAICGYCGHPMTAKNRNGKGTLYLCNRWNRERHGCPGHGIMASILDSAVWARVNNVLTEPEIIASELARLRRDDPTEADVSMVDGQLAVLARRQTALARAVGSLADDEDAAAPVVAQLRSLAEQKRQLEAERNQLGARREQWRLAEGRLTDLTAWCRNVAANLSEMTYDQKRFALAALGVQARVWKRDHDPRYMITMEVPIAETSPR